MQWFETNRIPKGRWPFLKTVYASLTGLEESIRSEVDLAEGGNEIRITGCMQAYRQAVICRVLDLAQSVVASWNVGHPIGAAVCSRSLIETVAIFHSFLIRAGEAAHRSNWELIGKLVDAYAFSTSSGRSKQRRTPEHPPRIGRIVTAFINATQPGKEEFWDQICDTAHPNGKRMLDFGGVLRDGKYLAINAGDSEPHLFVAIYNAMYSCCWLTSANLDFDILLEHVRNGTELSADHPPNSGAKTHRSTCR